MKPKNAFVVVDRCSRAVMRSSFIFTLIMRYVNSYNFLCMIFHKLHLGLAIHGSEYSLSAMTEYTTDTHLPLPCADQRTFRVRLGLMEDFHVPIKPTPSLPVFPCTGRRRLPLIL